MFLSLLDYIIGWGHVDESSKIDIPFKSNSLAEEFSASQLPKLKKKSLAHSQFIPHPTLPLPQNHTTLCQTWLQFDTPCVSNCLH